MALYNAMGGWGPYSVREIEDLFRTYGFEDTTMDIDVVSGLRREAVEAHQRAINWADPDQRRRYLMLVNDVLEEFPDQDGKPAPQAKAIRRALRLEAIVEPAVNTGPLSAAKVDLWKPQGAPRIFFSHLSKDKVAVHKLAEMLRAMGFACFVAHDEIRPSRAWQREIEKALATCDVLVAYLTEGFDGSEWTDQEVGWVLGRGLAAIPVSAPGGPNPYGFLGAYQAVRQKPHQDHVSLAREVFGSIIDAVFEGQRPQAAAITQKVAPLVTNAFSQSRSFSKACEHYGWLTQVPADAWTAPMRDQVGAALAENRQVYEAVLEDGTLVLEATRNLLASR